MLTELPDRTHELVGLMQAERQRLRGVYEFYDTPFVFEALLVDQPQALPLEAANA